MSGEAKSKKQEREDRLAKALRDNLRRRKAASRKVQKSDPDK